MGLLSCDCDPSLSLQPDLPEEEDQHEAVGTAWGAALSSFCFFASGAIIPVLPFLFGMAGYPAIVLSAALVGLALLGTGAIVGLLSGAPPLKRALRQLGIADFPRVVVAIGAGVEASVLTVLALVEIGVPQIWARATSTRHARIAASGDQWFVEDLGSTNGTYIGAVRITQPTTITLGTQVRIGKTVLELRK